MKTKVTNIFFCILTYICIINGNAQNLKELKVKNEVIIFIDSLPSKKTLSPLNKSNLYLKNGKLDDALEYSNRYTKGNPTRTQFGINNNSVIAVLMGDSLKSIKSISGLNDEYDLDFIKSNYSYTHLYWKTPIPYSTIQTGIEETHNLNSTLNDFNLSLVKYYNRDFNGSISYINKIKFKDWQYSKLRKEKDFHLIKANDYAKLRLVDSSNLYFNSLKTNIKNWGIAYNSALNYDYINGINYSLKSVKKEPLCMSNTANLYLLNDNILLAKTFANKLLEKDSTNVDGLNVLAYIKTKNNKEDSALIGFDQIIQLDSNYVPALISKGNIIRNRDSNFIETKVLYDRAFEINSTHEVIQADNAVINYDLGNWSESNKYTQMIHAQNRVFDPEIHLLTASNYFNLSQYNYALSSVNMFLQSNQQHDYGNLLKGYILYSLGSKESAKYNLNISLQSSHKPYQIASLQLLGVIQLELKEYEEAESSYKKYTQISSENFKAWNGLAMAQSELKNYADAHKNIDMSFSLAEGIDKDYVKCNKSVLYMNQGKEVKKTDKEDSKKYFKMAIATVDTLVTKYYNNMGVYYYFKDSKDTAITYFQTAGGDGGNNNLGVIASHKRDFKLANDFYQKAVDYDMRDYYIYHGNKYINASFTTGLKDKKDLEIAATHIGQMKAVSNFEEKFRFVYNWYYFPEFEATYNFKVYDYFEFYLPPMPEYIYPFYLFSDNIIRKQQELPTVAEKPGKYKGACPPHLSGATRDNDDYPVECSVVDSLVNDIIAEYIDSVSISNNAISLINLLKSVNVKCNPSMYEYSLVIMSEIYNHSYVQDMYLPVANKLMTDRLVRPTKYANYIDQLNIYKGVKQKYYTVLAPNSSGKYELPKDVDLTQVNSERSKIGLGKLEDEIQRLND